MKIYENRIRQIDKDEPIFTLPPYEVTKVFTPYSQTIDWGLKMFNIPTFWKFCKGKDIKVAVLDTGFDTKHHDLIDNVKDAKDFTKSRAGYHDVQGHGTHCAGIIAAKDNTSGVVGIAPEAELYIGKVLGDNGSGSEESVVNGINWAINSDVDIISMSLGSPYPSERIYDSISTAISNGMIIVCAAGNEGPYMDSVGYPAKFDEVIAVGAINQNKKISPFSSRGKQVDIVAPGEKILSSYPPNGLAFLSGTSMATPFVSGVAALILSKHKIYSGQTPINGQKDMEKHLRKTAIDIGQVGFDFDSGYGLINPEGLIKIQ